MIERPLLFVHVPKTAGTSFRSLLRGLAAGRTYVEMPLQESGRRRAAASLGRGDIVVGHVGYPLRDAFPVPPLAFTFLREPIDRALSNFSFLQNHPPSAPGIAEDEADFALAVGKTIGEFICDCPEAASRHLGNLHTWFLTRDGLTPRADLRELGRADLDKARENLRAIDVFGLVERMPESLLLILSAIHAPARLLSSMPDENRQASRLLSADLDASTLGAVREMCALDIALYEFAQELFEERLTAFREWASSWLPEYWLGAPESSLAAERALAAVREELFARLLREHGALEAALAAEQAQVAAREEVLAGLVRERDQLKTTFGRERERSDRAEQALLRTASDLALAREALARSEFSRAEAHQALSRADATLAVIRSSTSWRVLELARAAFGRRWNI